MPNLHHANGFFSGVVETRSTEIVYRLCHKRSQSKIYPVRSGGERGRRVCKRVAFEVDYRQRPDYEYYHQTVLMIFQKEIMTIAEQKGVVKSTCLKKCYFSEDLDFTSKVSDFELKQSHLDFICWHVKENAGILSHVESLSPLLFKDKLTGYEAVIKFWGSDHPRNEPPPPPDCWHTKIKIEVTLYGKLIFSVLSFLTIHLMALNTSSVKYSVIPSSWSFGISVSEGRCRAKYRWSYELSTTVEINAVG